MFSPGIFYYKRMHKHAFIREQDEWMYFLDVFIAAAGAATIYASVITFRGPAILITAFGLWFTFNKLKRDYSLNKARTHLFALILASFALAYLVYLLTN